MNWLFVDLVSIYSVGLFGQKNTTFYAADCENLEFRNHLRGVIKYMSTKNLSRFLLGGSLIITLMLSLASTMVALTAL